MKKMIFASPLFEILLAEDQMAFSWENPKEQQAKKKKQQIENNIGLAKHHFIKPQLPHERSGKPKSDKQG